MCGIIGYIGYAREGQWRETHDLLGQLLIAAEPRGLDATGFVARTAPLHRPSQKNVIVAKAPVPAQRFVQTNGAFRRLRHQRCSVVLGHVRAATHGDPANNKNNHPFSSDDLHLVHNGVVGNHQELSDANSLRLETDCDSEVLLRLIERAENVGVGLFRCLREVEGSMAVAVYDAKDDLVWIARNRGRPLWLARLRRDRRMFLASTSTILIDAFQAVRGNRVNGEFEMFMPMPEDTPLAISPDGLIVAPFPSGS